MSRKPLVIITALSPELLRTRLESAGYEVLYAPGIRYEALEEKIGEATGLIVTTHLLIDGRLIDNAGVLQWIGRLGSGMEMIDTAYAATKNIRCVSSPEGNRNAVAEHVLALVLNLLNHIHRSAAEVKDRKWIREENRGTELSGKTFGIIGYGNTGESVAKLLAGFGVMVLAYDKYRKGFSSGYVREATWEEVCSESDVISFHVPLTGETRYMADAAFFASLRRKPVFINASRGGVTDTNALVGALKQGLIAAAGLDVLENENLSKLTPEQSQQLDFLSKQQNVIITPHIAGYSHEAFVKMSEILLAKLGI